MFQRNTKLKKRGFHTERFSYIVLKKGARVSEGQRWKNFVEGREESGDHALQENVDLRIRNELIFDFCYLF